MASHYAKGTFVRIFALGWSQEPSLDMGFLSNIFSGKKKRADKKVSFEPCRLPDDNEASESPPRRAAPPARGSDYILEMINGETPEARNAAWRNLQCEIIRSRIGATRDQTATTPTGSVHRVPSVLDKALPPLP